MLRKIVRFKTSVATRFTSDGSSYVMGIPYRITASKIEYDKGALILDGRVFNCVREVEIYDE